MPPWLAFAIVAQFFFAVSVVVDKHIVVRAAHIGKPIVYAFYVSLLSGFVLILSPFGLVASPNASILFSSLLGAGAFLAAIFFLYSALRIARASDVAPVVGAVSTITTLVLAEVWLDGATGAPVFLSVGLLALGTALISRFHFSRGALGFALASGVFFGATVFLGKLVFLETDFLSGFFWTRASDVVVALALLLSPAARRAIFHGGKHSSGTSKAVVVGNKILGGVAGVLTAYAVSLGPVAVVNALSGLQFVFLFAFAFLFARPAARASRFPDPEVSHGHGGARSALGVALIVLGLALLYAARGSLV